MRIKSLQLKNFKRFTDLTLQDIPDSAKLVLLVGSNGSGKSSVFDAFEYVAADYKSAANTTDLIRTDEKKYYGKFADKETKVIITTTRGTLDNGFQPNKLGHNSGYVGVEGKEIDSKNFFGRSAVRYLSKLQKTVIGNPINTEADSDRPKFYIDKDNRFENDIELLLLEVVKKVISDFNGRTVGKVEEVKSFVDILNQSLARIFHSSPYSQLQLFNFETPADGNPAQLIFKKGQSEINYDLLSAGEKEIINLLINLYTRSKFFNDTVYFFDEIDAHLNTKLQYEVIKEIVEYWIPENCQLWTASHSLGFIQYAKDSELAVTFDLDDYDFDFAKVLSPEPKNNPEVYEIAVGKDILPKLFKNFNIVFAENNDVENYYSNINLPGFVMVKEKDRAGVFHKARAAHYFGLIDRDFLSDDDVRLLRSVYKQLWILNYYSVENYLYHPENIAEYFSFHNKPFDKSGYQERILKGKERALKELQIKLVNNRNSYPFGKEPGASDAVKKRFTPVKENEEQSLVISEELDSSELEVYYKHLPMKDYLKDLAERQIIARTDLAKTNWFKTQIEKILNEPN